MEAGAFQGGVVANVSEAQRWPSSPVLRGLSGDPAGNTRDSQEVRDSFCWFAESQQPQFHFRPRSPQVCSGRSPPGGARSHHRTQGGGLACTEHLCSTRAPLHPLRAWPPFRRCQGWRGLLRVSSPVPSAVLRPRHHRPACVQSCTWLSEWGRSGGSPPLSETTSRCLLVSCWGCACHLSPVTHRFSPCRCRGEKDLIPALRKPTI